jgi:hypothetical protein
MMLEISDPSGFRLPGDKISSEDIPNSWVCVKMNRNR